MRYFNKNLFIHFALGSIPAAFVGGIWSLDLWIYKKILGGVLFFAILRMLIKKDLKNSKIKKPSIFVAIIVGIVIGGLSGLIGIGGGIILTPVILLLHWGNIKEAAAVSALFIWVNSFSGLMGQLTSGVNFTPNTFVMVGLALAGGCVGGYYGSQKLNSRRLEYFLALVLTLAGIKLVLF